MSYCEIASRVDCTTCGLIDQTRIDLAAMLAFLRLFRWLMSAPAPVAPASGS